jgi:hypothetical protein
MSGYGKQIILTGSIAIVIAIGIGLGVYYAVPHLQNTATTSQQPKASGSISNVSATSTGCSVNWASINLVEQFTNSLVLGKVVGIANATVSLTPGSGYCGQDLLVQTFYLFHVNMTIAGNNVTEDTITIEQDGGVGKLPNGTTVDSNLTSLGYPSLVVGSSYVLALSNESVIGPNAMFHVATNDTIYVSPRFLTISEFQYFWNSLSPITTRHFHSER